MTNRFAVPVATAALVLTAGCLQKETSHTLYLSPEGTVAWTADEANVYSGESDEGKRTVEEQAYLGPVLLGSHAMARALAALAPAAPVRTTIVRDERPFHVITEARFDRIDRVLERLFTKAGVKSTASFAREADRAMLRVRLDFSSETERDPTVLGLLDVEHLRFVLTDGEFEAVTDVDVNGRTAAFSREWLDGIDKALDEKRPIEFTLAWRY